MPYVAINIEGKRFGYLTAIRFVEKRKTNMKDGLGKGVNHFWEFKCDCGNIKVMNKNGVTRGSVKSCGCLHLKNVARKPKGEANFTHAYHYYKSRAKKSGRDFMLTKSQFKILTKGMCYYCGSIPSNFANDKNCNGAYAYNGIDRIDNNRGYLLDNVVTCCKKCNIAKSTMTQEDFLDLINKIFYNRISGGVNV